MKQPWEPKRFGLAEWPNPLQLRGPTPPPNIQSPFSVCASVCLCVFGRRSEAVENTWNPSVYLHLWTPTWHWYVHLFSSHPSKFCVLWSTSSNTDVEQTPCICCSAFLCKKNTQNNHLHLVYCGTPIFSADKPPFFSSYTQWENIILIKKTCQAETTDIVSWSLKDSIVSQFTVGTILLHRIISRLEIRLRFFLQFWVVPDNLVPTVNAHLDHKLIVSLESLRLHFLWNNPPSTRNIPPSLWLEMTPIAASCWCLSVCTLDQGCAEATCHNAPVRRRKCSSPHNHNTYTSTLRHSQATCSKASCNIWVAANVLLIQLLCINLQPLHNP